MNERKMNPSGLRALLDECPMLLSIVVTGLMFALMLVAFKGCKASDTSDPAANPGMDAHTQAVDSQESAAAVPEQTTASTVSVAPETVWPAETESDRVDTTESEVQSSETEAQTTEAPAPDLPGTDPEGFTVVDESYFEDALFIGDSRTDGLNLYCPVGNAKHYSGTSMTIFKIMDTTDVAYGYYGIRGVLQSMQFGKIYIMFGINEAGYDTDAFAEKYRSVIEEIRSYQPNAIIYIQSILYVTQNHEANNPVFSSAGLKEKNAKLKELANGVDIFYLEVNDALNDGTDHLPSEYTGDGVHLKASYYYLWKDYLLQHAIVNAAHPWEPQTEADSGND